MFKSSKLQQFIFNIICNNNNINQSSNLIREKSKENNMK